MSPNPERLPASYFSSSVRDFVDARAEAIIGRLASADPFERLEASQRYAWTEEIEILRGAVGHLEGWIYLEFEVPRLGSRIDAVFISASAVFPIEFKCGEKEFTAGAYNQAWDYALDLKNFHQASHEASNFPLLVATQAPRSSYYLEDAATEFQVQGLEVDWACVTWDADLRRDGDDWRFHSFRGDTWASIHKPDRQRYLLNAHRVLLTRARQGMVLFVPPGDDSDPTRNAKWYQATYSYLCGLGITSLDE